MARGTLVLRGRDAHALQHDARPLKAIHRAAKHLQRDGSDVGHERLGDGKRAGVDAREAEECQQIVGRGHARDDEDAEPQPWYVAVFRNEMPSGRMRASMLTISRRPVEVGRQEKFE